MQIMEFHITFLTQSILLGIFAIFSVANQYFVDKFFKHLEEQEPSYYKKIGSPKAGFRGLKKGAAISRPTPNVLLRTPDDFPQNNVLRGELTKIRSLTALVLGIWAILMIAMFFSY